LETRVWTFFAIRRLLVMGKQRFLFQSASNMM
jgi:hypothetical protein